MGEEICAPVVSQRQILDHEHWQGKHPVEYVVYYVPNVREQPHDSLPEPLESGYYHIKVQKFQDYPDDSDSDGHPHPP
jgi:hypothetical protein